MADLGGMPLACTLPFSNQMFLNFMQFLEHLIKLYPSVGTPHVKILDPPLQKE